MPPRPVRSARSSALPHLASLPRSSQVALGSGVLWAVIRPDFTNERESHDEDIRQFLLCRVQGHIRQGAGEVCEGVTRRGSCEREWAGQGGRAVNGHRWVTRWANPHCQTRFPVRVEPKALTYARLLAGYRWAVRGAYG